LLFLVTFKAGEAKTMSNMSYCRFENTSGDLADGINAVEEVIENGTSADAFRDGLSSDHERRAFLRMKDQCEKFVELFGELALPACRR
jgi:hypothetical protein